MSDQFQAQTHVLDRLMYLLEEGSVSQLVQKDKNFDTFVSQLYATLQLKADQLQYNG